MSDTWFNLIIEMGVLAFLGLLYYFYQKRKIIRFDKEEIFELVGEVTYELNHFLEEKKEEAFYNTLNIFCTQLEECSENSSIQQLHEILKELPSNIPEKIKIKVQEIKIRLEFHEPGSS